MSLIEFIIWAWSLYHAGQFIILWEPPNMVTSLNISLKSYLCFRKFIYFFSIEITITLILLLQQSLSFFFTFVIKYHARKSSMVNNEEAESGKPLAALSGISRARVTSKLYNYMFFFSQSFSNFPLTTLLHIMLYYKLFLFVV